MSRNWYWLGAAVPLVIALTTIASAASPSGSTAETPPAHGAMVSLEATNVTLSELTQRLGQALGAEVRIEGPASGTVTLNLKDVSAATLLAQAATTLGGRWQTVYRLSAHEPAAAPAAAGGQLLNLKMADVSCLVAAAVVARMAGGRLERDGELAGQVTLIGDAIPVEEAMDSIARASNSSWRRIYIMKIDALPQVASSKAGSSRSTTQESGEKKPKSNPGRWSSHATSNGRPAKFVKRDRFKAGGREAPPGLRALQPTLEEMRKHAMLGLYGSFFLIDSPSGRETAMKNFRSGLEGQLKRLAALPANQRRITTQMTRTNFQRLIQDFGNLDKDQKKEAQALYDFAKEQLTKPPLNE